MNFDSWRLSANAVLLLVLIAASAGAQPPLFLEGFEGMEGTRPSRWEFPNSSSQEFWTVQSGRLTSGEGDADGENLTWAVVDRTGESMWVDFEISADFWMLQDTGQLGLAARYIDESNYYAAILRTFRRPGSDQIQSQIEIVKATDGMITPLTSLVAPDDVVIPEFHGKKIEDEPSRFSLAVVGANLVASVDGRQIALATDSELIGGSAAVGQAFNSVQFDNIEVRSSGAATLSEVASTAGSSTAGSPGANAQGVYRLVMIDRGPNEDIARGLATDLESYGTVDIEEHGDGRYSVYFGSYATEREAETAREEMSATGFLITEIRYFDEPVQVARTGQTTPAPTPAEEEDDEWKDLIGMLEPTGTPAGGQTQPAAQPTPTPAPAATPDQFAALRDAALAAEQAGNYQEAIGFWTQIKNEAQEGPMYQQSVQRIAQLNQALRDQDTAGTEGELPLELIIGIVAGVVVLAILVLFVVLRTSKKRDEELRKKVEELAQSRAAAPPASSPSKPTAQPAPAQTSPLPPPAKPAAPVSAPQKQAASDVREVGSADRIRPGTMMPARDEPAPGTPATIAEAAAAPPPPRAGEQSDGEIRLDFLFEDEAKTEEEKPQEAETPAEPRKPSNQKIDSTEFIIPPQPDVEPGTQPHTAPAPEPSGATPQPVKQTDPNIFYQQDFEDEEVGVKPKNWNGDYEYAALAVAENDTGGQSKKCLRFEKKSGVGSAYYSCRFPNAGGRIAVEFDIRCDDKNKYLLGFYIEKDEDFRQSIHTIVHRTNSSANPTLRIQNESTPYEFGTWKHIRFEIDLPRHLIDGYADDQPIAMGVRLNSCPKVINTLSIRDNLATTGVLMIDNIKIHRIS